MFPMARKQAGFTIWGWMGVFALVAFFTRVVVVLYPMLYNHYKIMQHLKQVAADPATLKMDNKQIVDTLRKRFSLDNIEYVNLKDMSISPAQNGKGKLIELPYEVRAQFFGPIYILGDFSETHVEVGG